MIKMNSRMFIRVTAAVFLAAILALAFITAQETPAPPPAGKKPPVKMGPRESLGLTAGQEKALEEFQKARRDESRAFRDEMQKMRGEMRELAKDPKANEAKIDGLIDKTAQLRAERAKAAFKHRGEVEKIFTPEQLEKMRAFRAQAMDRPEMAGRGRMGFGRMGFRGPGMGRFMGPGFGMRPGSGHRPWRHRPLFWRRW
ncbi:MAG: Spy/CpxP family protein refolding chaperone [Acidobacteria bacterium]|nr:Spy/CpxP family protein refolding chaperone [Acidobacteriota bacterium]